ncbi:MAG: Fic family protein [Nitrospinae bacterium]|nr:Fic family protein [Nitrospinota bacterium]
MVTVALRTQRPFLSQALIKALNYHAIACLHVNAGEYRPCEVKVGSYEPPAHYRVQALMDDFVNLVNRYWENEDPVLLSAFVLWQLNVIHPFINGNGRTARACCYFVLCVKSGGWISGKTILPELLRQHREEYVSALQYADNAATQKTSNQEALKPLCELIRKLLDIQIAGH